MKEFTRKYRPATLDAIIGQPDAVRVIRGWLKNDDVPHAIVLHGPSGVGKTTAARILKKELGCTAHDFCELNCADTRGIDTIREIRRNMNLQPAGKSRIWLLDEAHQLGGPPQNALLKLLEDTPAHVYFILCTTDPQKLIKTIQTRCSMVGFKSVAITALLALLGEIAKKAEAKVSADVIERIAESADGSPRKALTLLHQIAGLESEEKQLAAIERADSKTDAIQIARALMDGRTRWPDMAKILKGCDLAEPEQIRHMVLGYCSTILLSGKAAGRAAMIIDYFADPWYESRKAGLILSCWNVISAK